MHLVAIAWIYVVLMMALAEALSSQGTVLGAVITFVLYGLLPLSVLLYIMSAPARGRARRTAEAAAVPTAARTAGRRAIWTAVSVAVSRPRASARRPTAVATAAPSATPDGGGMAPGDAVAPEGKEA